MRVQLALDKVAAEVDANVAAQPTAKVFRLSAFDWGNRRAVGFFRSAWSAAAVSPAKRTTPPTSVRPSVVFSTRSSTGPPAGSSEYVVVLPLASRAT
jgi:hypothetical protein